MDSAELICQSSELKDGGLGVRFDYQSESADIIPAFVIRKKGVVRGYLNRCGHILLELDFLPGRFFDTSGEFLMCATHGALYDPDTGRCISGPCNGRGLEVVNVLEKDGNVYWFRE